MRWLLVLLALNFSPSLWAETIYSYAGFPFTLVLNFTPPCATGPCANIPAGAKVTGSFTTVSPLDKGLPSADIYSRVKGYSFSDGLNTYSSIDPNSRVLAFQAGTDAGGNITTFKIVLDRWQTGSSPHAVNDRVALLVMDDFAHIESMRNNGNCYEIGAAPYPSPDNCIGIAFDSATSDAYAPASPGVWSKTTLQAAVPTLSMWATAVLVAIVLGLTFWELRRRGKASVR